jgi:hypothetical protein
MTRTAKIVLGVAAGVFFLCVIAISFGVWMVMSAFQTEAADPNKAKAAFDEIRAKFAGVQPAFEMNHSWPKVVRQPPATPASPQPETVRILVWDGDEGRIARISLPFSILKLSNDPIEFNGVTLEVEDVERYGRTLLIDGDTPEGDSLLVWTE